MTSLMVIFILLLVASLNNAKAEGESARNAVLSNLQRALQKFAAQGVTVEADPKDPLGLLVLVPGGLLNFEVDKWDIRPAGISFLHEFAPRLANTACSKDFRNEMASIVVEGHTDTTGTDEHNLQLSQNRSMSVVQQILHELGDASTNGNRACFLDLLSANGRGSVEAIKVNGKEDRDKSRRVIFKIRVRSLEQREIKALLGLVMV